MSYFWLHHPWQCCMAQAQPAAADLQDDHVSAAVMCVAACFLMLASTGQVSARLARATVSRTVLHKHISLSHLAKA